MVVRLGARPLSASDALAGFAKTYFAATESALVTRARHRQALEQTVAAIDSPLAEATLTVPPTSGSDAINDQQGSTRHGPIRQPRGERFNQVAIKFALHRAGRHPGAGR